MTTRAHATNPKIRVRWQNPPAAGPRLTLARTMRGLIVERNVGPRGLLTIAEAAAVLERPVGGVRRAIRTRFLPARRRGGQVLVTVAACYRFLAEEREDGKAAGEAIESMRRTGEKPIPSDQVFRELGLE